MYLFEIMKKSNYVPEKIHFADDTHDYIENVNRRDIIY